MCYNRLTAQIHVFCILAYPVYTVHMVRGKEYPGHHQCIAQVNKHSRNHIP